MSMVRLAVIASGFLFSFPGVSAAGPLDRCKAFYDDFRLAEATACFGQQIASGALSKSDLFDALMLRAEINEVSDGDLDARVADLTRAIELKPTDPYAYNSRGIAHAKAGRYQAAVDDYAKYITLLPKDDIEKAWGYGNACEALMAWKKLDEALTYCDRALRLAEYPAAYEARGHVRHLRKEYDLAVGDFSKAIEISRENSKRDGLPSAYIRRAYALEALGYRDRAVADVRTAMKQVDDLDASEKDALRELTDRLGITGPDAKPADIKKAPPAAPRGEVASDPGPRVLHTRGYNGPAYVTGTFTRTAKGAWEERNSQNGAAVMTFRQVEGDSSRLLLHDRSRDLYITVDLARKKLTWRTGTRGPWNPFYDIERIQY